MIAEEGKRSGRGIPQNLSVTTFRFGVMNGKARGEQKFSAPGPKAGLRRRVIAHHSTVHEQPSPPARCHAPAVRNTIQANNAIGGEHDQGADDHDESGFAGVHERQRCASCPRNPALAAPGLDLIRGLTRPSVCSQEDRSAGRKQ
jgi:hypothetical protein